MMKKKLFTIFVLLLFQINATLCQEVQTNVDLDNKIEYITKKLEQKIQMFPGFNNFQEARLFKISDSLYVLEILYKPGEQLLKNRKMLNPTEVLTFQEKVTAKLLQESPERSQTHKPRHFRVWGGEGT